MATWTSQQDGDWSRTSDNADSPWYDDGAQSALASVPADTDTVTIDNTHEVTFDVDQSGFGTGITLTVADGGILIADTAAGSYYLKCQADITNNGEMKAGSSDPAYPSTCTFKIELTGDFSIDCSGGGTIAFYCTEPTNKWIALSAQEAAAQTELSVDTDVTGDIWADGDTIHICDGIQSGSTLDNETRVIDAGGIAAEAITVTAGITNQKESGAKVILISRNIKISNSTDYAVKGSDGSVINAEVTTAKGTYYCENDTYGGAWIPTGTGFLAPENCTLNGVVSYISASTCWYQGLGCTMSDGSGIFGTTNAFGVTSSGCTMDGLIWGCQTGFYTGNDNNITGDILYGQTGLLYCGGGLISGTISNNTAYGLSLCTGFTLANATLSSNASGDLRRCGDGSAYNTTFGSATEFLDYDFTGRTKNNDVKSFNHDGTENAFKGWYRGGIVTSQTASPPTGYDIWYEHACEDTTQNYPVFRQFETTVQPGTAIEVEGKIRIADGEDMTGYAPALQIIDKFADPLVDSSKEPLDEDEIPDPDGSETGWQDVSVIWANQGDAPRIVLVRMIAWCHSGGATDIDECWSIADYQDQIQTIYDKLPTNYIMGSDDQDDHNAELEDWEDGGRLDLIVDAILADTDEIQDKLPDNYIMGSSDTEDHDDEIDAIVAELGQTETREDETPGGGGVTGAAGIAEGC